MTVDILLMIVGLTILTVGADWLVRGASALAIAMSISPLVVGLTVVAYGTGAPELVISLQALLQGETDITVGNVIGSNLFNILPTLGIAALITPLVVHAQLVRLDVPLLILASGLFWWFASDLSLGFYESCFLTFLLVVYSVWVVLKSRRETRMVQREYEEEYGDDLVQEGGVWWHQLIRLALGLALLVGGAKLFLDHAVHLANLFKISPLVIGLTLVAGGTSLPELATTVMAAFRGERDIAVGNAIGSSLFNILGVLGISGILAQEGLPVSRPALDFDIPVMFAVAVACLPLFFIRPMIARWQGAIFLSYYVAYTVYLVMDGLHLSVTRTYEGIMLYFFIPLTGMAIMVGVARKLMVCMKGQDSGSPD